MFLTTSRGREQFPWKSAPTFWHPWVAWLCTVSSAESLLHSCRYPFWLSKKQLQAHSLKVVHVCAHDIITAKLQEDLSIVVDSPR